MNDNKNIAHDIYPFLAIVMYIVGLIYYLGTWGLIISISTIVAGLIIFKKVGIKKVFFAVIIFMVAVGIIVILYSYGTSPAKLQPGIYYISPKIAPIYDLNQNKAIGEVYGGVVVNITDAGKTSLRSGFVGVGLDGWIFKGVLEDATPGKVTLLKSEDNLWVRSQMAKHQEQPNYRVAMLKPGTSVQVLELDENFARIWTFGSVKKDWLVSQRKVKKSQQGEVHDILTNGLVSVWLTDVTRTLDVNPIRGEVSYPVKIIFQVKNEGAGELKIWAVRTTMFGAKSGSLTMTTVHTPKEGEQSPFSLGSGEVRSFEFDHDGYDLRPYPDTAMIMLFLEPIDPKAQTESIDLSNTFVFIWSEDDIRGIDY